MTTYEMLLIHMAARDQGIPVREAMARYLETTGKQTAARRLRIWNVRHNFIVSYAILSIWIALIIWGILWGLGF